MKYQFIIEGVGMMTESDSLDEMCVVVAEAQGRPLTGNLVDSTTAEVLMTVTEGVLNYIATDTTVGFIRDIHEANPESAQSLLCAGIATFEGAEDAIGKQTHAALLSLHEELFGRPASELDIALAGLALMFGIL